MEMSDDEVEERRGLKEERGCDVMVLKKGGRRGRGVR
jgi:hypothetical protein